MTEKRGGNDGEGQDRGVGWVKGTWREWWGGRRLAGALMEGLRSHGFLPAQE